MVQLPTDRNTYQPAKVSQVYAWHVYVCVRVVRYVLCCDALAQNVISGLSGASIGAGFSVSTWSPFLCVLPNNVSTLVWVQFTMFLAAFPLAAVITVLSLRVSSHVWKGVYSAFMFMVLDML